jgi:8-oxo-dGTP pyrophosphatase MutT (NUDIX family)
MTKAAEGTPSNPIVRRRTSVIVTHDNKLLVFKAVDPHDGRTMMFLPGGKIESNESEAECAERETKEETNYKVKVDETTRLESQYPFHWNGKDYHSITIFFRGQLAEAFKPAGPVQDDDYNKGPLWIPLAEVPDAFAYCPAIRDAVLELASR